MSESWIRPNGIGKPESYAFPNPTVTRRTEAVWKARHDVGALTRDEGYALAEMAEAYWHLLCHPAGTGAVVKQLREVRACLRWAARAALAGEE